jgi:hypothetical protein
LAGSPGHVPPAAEHAVSDIPMTEPSATSGATSVPALGLPSRFIGIITSPKATFQAVAAHPRWFGMLALTTLIVACCTALPMFTEAGRQAALDQQVQQMESFGFEVGDEQYARMEQGMRIAPYTTFGGILVFAPIMAVIITGVLFAVFNAAMGGNATFKQLFSVVVHGGVVSAVAQLFTAPLNYLRGSMSSTTNLAVLLPMIDENSFLGSLLGMIDLFLIWYVIVLAIGLAVLYKRRTQPIAISLFVVYGVIAVVVALVKSSFGGSN